MNNKKIIILATLMNTLAACSSLQPIKADHPPIDEKHRSHKNDIISNNDVDFKRVEKLAKVSLSATQKDQEPATKELIAAGYDQIKYFHDIATDTTAVIAADKNEIILAIRGLDSPKDKKTAVSFTHKESAIGGDVSTGFLDTLRTTETDSGTSILNTLAKTIQKFSDNAETPLPVTIASHSMGGALSSAFVAELVGNKDKTPEYDFIKNIETVITFGSISPGDSEFKEQYAKMCKENNIECISIVRERDLTPIVVPTNRAVGTQVFLKDGAENAENVIINPTAMEKLKRIMFGDFSSKESHSPANMLKDISEKARNEDLPPPATNVQDAQSIEVHGKGKETER